MLVGLVAAGFYSCFYDGRRAAACAGMGAAGVSVLTLLFPQTGFASPLQTSFWLMFIGICHAVFSRSRMGLQRQDWERLFHAGGIWLMAHSLAGFGTGQALLQTGSLQTALAAALLLMGALELLGRRRWRPLWMTVLAVLWLLVRFLSSIPYTKSWQNQVMTVSLYLAVGGILVIQQIYCVWRAGAAWQRRQEGPAGCGDGAEGMGDRAGKVFCSDAEEAWREAAGREYRQLQIFEHDFRHHLDIVAALYEEGGAAEARAYIEDLKQARESRRGRKIGGEREISYIMMAKKESCRQREITFSYQIVGSPRGIAQMDMTALLLNLLDNAIRACEKAPRPRSIAVMLLSRGELWEIEMINSGRYEAGGSEAGGRTRPSEETRKIHGIGLVSVRQIVDKYQGTYRIWEEEGQVRQKLILVQRETDDKLLMDICN